MAVSAEHRALHHAIDDLRTATTSLRTAHGDVPVVARLRNDLERLILDVADVDALPRATAPAAAWTAETAVEAAFSADDPYAPPTWDDVDDEGVGGYRGPAPKSRR